MCRRCAIYDSAFGSKEPLAPRIASIHEDPVSPPKSATLMNEGLLKPLANIAALRCAIYDSAFGSKAPLAPRIASIHEDPVSPPKPATLMNEGLLTPLANTAAVKPLGLPHSTHEEEFLSTPVSPSLERGPVNNGYAEDYTGSQARDASAKGSSKSLDPVSTMLSQLHITASSSGPAVLSSANIPRSVPTVHSSLPASDSAPTSSTASSIASSTASSPVDSVSSAQWSNKGTVSVDEAIGKKPLLASIIEHADILHSLLQNCPDFPTLFALVTTCKTTKRAFEQHPQGIIKAMLSTMSQELQYLTVALIGINGSYAGSSRAIRKLMETWLSYGPKPLAQRLRVCIREQQNPMQGTYSRREIFRGYGTKPLIYLDS